MIDREKAKGYIRRFAGKHGFPKEFPEAVEALIDAMQKAPHDDAHAKLIAEELEIETHFCPEPSEVWRMARITGTRRPVGCKECSYTGFTQVTIRGVEAVRFCPCRTGADGDRTETRRGNLKPMKEIAR